MVKFRLLLAFTILVRGQKRPGADVFANQEVSPTVSKGVGRNHISGVS
jgi:hypothetical protein